MSKNILFVVIIGILATGIFVLFNQLKPKQSVSIQPSVVISPANRVVDYKAAFAIFTNGTFRVFTAAMYHDQSEDVFIQADNPNIIQVKKSNITWDDFFRTLPFKLTKDCLITGTGETFCSNNISRLGFYLNRKEDPNALDKVISKGDRLLVTYGNENEQQIQNQLQKIPVIK